MIAATDDRICSYKNAEKLRDAISSTKSFVTMQGEGHIYFSYASDKAFMDDVIDALENIDGPGAQAAEFLN